MKDFKKFIREAYLGNPLNEEDRATRVDKMLAGEYEDEDYKDSEFYADVRADLENEDKLPDGFHSKEDLDQFLKDNPFDSERYKKLSIAQKQDILSYLNRDTEKEFERRMAMREELDPKDFPANFFYGGKIYVFDRIAGSDRAVYYNPKYKGDNLVFGSKKQMDDFLDDYVEPKGGTQSSHFGTNENINEGKFEVGDEIVYRGNLPGKVVHVFDYQSYINPSAEYKIKYISDSGNTTTARVRGKEIALKKDLDDMGRKYFGKDYDLDEGTCGYGEDGVIGDKPAGAHLQKEDMNDPVLVKARAAKMAAEKEKAKQAALDKKYGSSFMDKLDAEIGLKQELQDLKDEREQLMIDMEQEAEPEGGEIADRYGSRLNDIDAKMAEIKSELDDLRMYESVNESKYRVEYEDEDDNRHYIEIKASSEEEAEQKSSSLDGFRTIKSIESVNEDEIDEEIETSLTPNEIGDEAVEKESNSAAYESLQETLRKKLQDRLK